VNNNDIFKLCVPSNEDCFILESTKIDFIDLRVISIDWMRKNVIIKFLAPLSIHSGLSIFSFPGSIELSPITCEVKIKISLAGNIIPGILNKVVYSSMEHAYLVEIQFSLLDIQLYNGYMLNTVKKQNKDCAASDGNIGELLDLE